MARRKKTNEDQPQDNPENVNDSDDNFGLPEIEYTPLNREEQKEEVEEVESVEEVTVNTTQEYEPEVVEDRHDDHIFNETEESPSSAPKVIGIGILLIIISIAVWFFAFEQPKRKAAEERAKQEELLRQEATRKAEEIRMAELKRQEDEQRRADSLANATPKIGTIETLGERTRLYYVVVASSIDDDLIMDYAKKLSLKGVNTKIIPPFGNVKFSRLAIAQGDTYADAQSTADGLKSEYEGGAWVVKY